MTKGGITKAQQAVLTNLLPRVLSGELKQAHAARLVGCSRQVFNYHLYKRRAELAVADREHGTRQNSFNAAHNERFQIGCGSIQAIVNARTEGAAFRKAIKETKSGRDDFGLLARFRIVALGHRGALIKCSPWFYQHPDDLLKTA